MSQNGWRWPGIVCDPGLAMSSGRNHAERVSIERWRGSAVWYHTYGMRKTTVYLNDEEVEGLRQLAATTGRTQAELIREAIRQATARAQTPRRFRSLGKGQGPGGPTPRWNPAKLYEKRVPSAQSD